MFIDRDTYNAQAAKDFETETPDPFQPARDALQFARDTAAPWQPAQWANDAADFARSTAPGMGDVQRSGQVEQPAEPAPAQEPTASIGDALGNAGQSIGGAAGAVGQAIGSGLQTARNAIPTTAAISNPSQGQGYPSMGLGDIYRIAKEQGLDEDGARVAVAIAKTEGGLTGAAGDGGKSFGPFQFYGNATDPGMLNSYAKQMGMGLEQAGEYVRQNPASSVEWALRQGGYLGDAIRRGQGRGIVGAELATYAQNPGEYQNRRYGDPGGQVSVSPERAGRNYQALFVGGQPAALESVGPAMASQPDQGRAPYSFPVAGYSGKDVPLHWGSNSGGTDLFAAEGTPVVAMRGGKVISSSSDSIGGNAVLIQGDDGNQYYYAHLYQTPAVKNGQVVGAGDYLGGVGDTGNAKGTGPHLHFGMGPSIVNGAGPQGGTGAGFDAVGLLRTVLAGGVPAIGDAMGNAGRAVGNAWDQATAPRAAPDMSGVVEPGQRPNPGVDAGRDPGFAWKAAQPGMGDVQRYGRADPQAPVDPMGGSMEQSAGTGDFGIGRAVGDAAGRAGQAIGTGLQTVGDVVGPVASGQSGSIIADLPGQPKGINVRANVPNPATAQAIDALKAGRADFVQSQTDMLTRAGIPDAEAAQMAEEHAAKAYDARISELEGIRQGKSITAGAPTNEQTMLGGGDFTKAVESGNQYMEQNPVGAGIAGILSPATFPEKIVKGLQVAHGVGELGAGAALAMGSLRTLKAGEAAKAGQIGQPLQTSRLVDAAGNLLGKPTKVEAALDGLVVPGQAAPEASVILGPGGQVLSAAAPGGAVLRTASGVEAAPVAISPETLRRLPNLLKIDVPKDVIATLVRTAQENPALFDKYQQGVITHDELVGDLAPRLGMTAGDFLKTKVGQAFNPEELFVLRATVVDKAQSLAGMAQSINAQGGIGALSDAGRADAMRSLVEAARLQAVARGGATTAGRALNQQKIVLDTMLSRSIVGSNEAKAAEKALSEAQAKQARLQARMDELQKLQAGNALKAEQRAELDRIGKEAEAAKQEEAAALLRRQAARDKEAKTTLTQQERARKALDALGGRDVTEDVLKQFLQLQGADDPLAMAKFLKGVAQPTLWGRIGVIRYGSMLSATSSHLANATGNLIMTGVDLASKPVAAGIDATRAAITGGPRTRYMAEAWPEAQGLAEGAIAGAREAWTVIKTGINPTDAGKVENIRSGFGVNPVVDFAAEAPLRFMEAADLIFRGAATSGNFRVLAMRQALQEGYKGKGAAQRVQEIAENSTDFPELLEQAQKLGARIVVQEKRAVTNYLGGSRRVPGLNYVSDVMMPFVRTPYNIAAQGVGMTPVGFVGVLNDVRKGNPGAAADTAARALMGTAVMGVSASLAAQGFLTGAYPEDAQVRSALPPGWQPWSIRIPHGDGTVTYIGYQNLGPLGVPLAISALIGADMAKGKAALTPEYAGKMAASVGKYMSDQTFLRGIGELLKAINEPDRYAENLVEGLATQIVPYGSLQRQLTRALDVGTRDPHGALQAILALNPSTAGQVPAKQDVFGQPVKPAQTGLGAFISPVRYDVAGPNQVLVEYGRLQGEGFNVGIAKPPAKIRTVELTGEEQRRLQTMTGGTLQPLLGKVIASQPYQQLSDQDKATLLDRLESQVRAQSAEAMAMQMGREFLRRYQAAGKETQ